MIRVALKGLAGRKFRAALTAIAIVLGVAMISGTYILTDTIDKAFGAIFEDTYAGTDAIVTGQGADISFEGETSELPPVDASLLPQIRQLPEVEAAAGSVVEENAAKIIGDDGKVIDTQGAPALGFGIDFAQPRFNPLKLLDGRWPQNGNEVVIDTGVADDEGFQIGDTVRVASLQPVRPFELVGIAQYGTVSSLGAITFAVFTIPEAQQLFEREGKYDAISAAAKSGITQDELVQSIRPDPAAGRQGAVGRGAGPGGQRRRERVHVVHPLLPARVRRHLAVRRRVRHLQHALDHGRAARPRVRRPCGRSARPGGRSSGSSCSRRS